MAENEPIVKMDPGGRAVILSYNVPEPTSYFGRHLIDLQINPNYFKDEYKTKPAESTELYLKGIDPTALKNIVLNAMKGGFTDKMLFPTSMMNMGILRLSESPNPGLSVISNMPVHPALAKLDPNEVAAMMQAGMKLNIYKSMFGTLTYNYIPIPTEVRPRLFLVETYRLTSYLGSYGAGRTIKTFSLLPGEKTKISLKTYTKTETEAKSASSILDSFTQDSADDFEQSLQSEHSNKEEYKDNFEYHAEAEASCSWGFGSAKVSGGVKGGTNSAREEFAKNAANATQKHAAKASAKRDVQVNTSHEAKETSGEENSIEREIQNINVSRTLNFVFRQMNQEFITLLHLIDVRIGFFSGFAGSKKEVTLPELESLLKEVIADGPSAVYPGKTRVQEVKQDIIEQLTNIFDYHDNQCVFVEEKTFLNAHKEEIPGATYLRVKKDFKSVYKDESNEITVPGIILSVQKSVMRTEGIIVDALLGQGDGLDQYSHGLQDETIRAKRLANDLLQAQIKREELGQQVVKDKDETAMKVFEGVFPQQIVSVKSEPK